jgi:hypothetical protein
MGGHGLGFFPWRSGIGLRLLLRQLTRMHRNETQFLLGDAPITVLDFHLAEHTVAMPAPGHLVPGPPGFLRQQG